MVARTVTFRGPRQLASAAGVIEGVVPQPFSLES